MVVGENGARIKPRESAKTCNNTCGNISIIIAIFLGFVCREPYIIYCFLLWHCINCCIMSNSKQTYDFWQDMRKEKFSLSRFLYKHLEGLFFIERANIFRLWLSKYWLMMIIIPIMALMMSTNITECINYIDFGCIFFIWCCDISDKQFWF